MYINKEGNVLFSSPPPLITTYELNEEQLSFYNEHKGFIQVNVNDQDELVNLTFLETEYNEALEQKAKEKAAREALLREIELAATTDSENPKQELYATNDKIFQIIEEYLISLPAEEKAKFSYNIDELHTVRNEYRKQIVSQ